MVSALKKLLIITAALLATGLFAAYWFGSAMHSPNHIIERVGGLDILKQNTLPRNATETIYYESLRISRTPYSTKKPYIQPCTDDTTECMTINLAITNTHLLNGTSNEQTDLQIEHYKNSLQLYDGGCPVKHEITSTIKATTSIMQLNKADSSDIARDHSIAAISSIYLYGGLHHDLRTDECKELFIQNPYLAQAYFFHTYLLLGAINNPLPEWTNTMQLPSLMRFFGDST